MIDDAHDVLFVGGVPAASAEAVLRLCGKAAGPRALSLPDGELGARSFWIGSIGDATWSKVDGLQRFPKDPDDPVDFGGTYRIKDRSQPLSIEGHMAYSPDAIASYALFVRLRQEGVIAPGVRFQVSVPTPHAAAYPYFRDAGDWPQAWAAWSAGLRSEFARILEHVPPDDLVIQLDYCTELTEIHGDLSGLAPWVPEATAEERFAIYTAPEYLGPISADLPSEVLLGYHLCAGTYPTQPVSNLETMRLAVDLANAIAANTARRVDYFQMPVMRESGDAYFAPLADLDIGEAKVYLGIECDDGLDEMRRRIEAARRYLPSFGVSHYCGYRPDKAPMLDELIGDLVRGADAVRSV